MSRCPQCAQLLAADATHCPACGHDLHTRRLQTDEIVEHDPELDREELLTAAIATEGTGHAPPPWVPSLEARMRPKQPSGVEGDELRDVVPEDSKKPFWRRHP